MNKQSTTLHRILYMAGLVIAGEAIFALPFHVARSLKILDGFNIKCGHGRRIACSQLNDRLHVSSNIISRHFLIESWKD